VPPGPSEGDFLFFFLILFLPLVELELAVEVEVVERVVLVGNQAAPSRRPAAQPRLHRLRGMIVDEVLLAGIADEALQPKGLPLPVARELERPVVQPQVAPSTDRTRFPFTERTPAS